MTKRKRILGVVTLTLMLFVGGIAVSQKTAKAADATTLTLAVKHPALDTIKLSWNPVDGANGYHIYLSVDNGGSYKLVNSVNNTAAVFDNLTRDKNYYFKVAAFVTSNGVETETVVSDVAGGNSNRIGIDVSKYQKNIDWAKVKSSGIEYAIIRAGYTTVNQNNGSHILNRDEYFVKNMTNAIPAGMPVGVYYYSKATTINQVKLETNYLLKQIAGYNLTYPVVLDFEDNIMTPQSKATNTKIINTFCKMVRDAGYTPMVYSGCNFSKNEFNIKEIQADLWIAHYSKDGSVVNNYLHYYKDSNHYPYTRMWQYSSSISVDGIAGNVDHDYEFDLAESVVGMTHYDMKTGELTCRADSTDTVTTVATKCNVTPEVILAKNPELVSVTSLAGVSVKLDCILLDAVNLVVKEDASHFASLTWSGVSGGANYTVMRSNAANGPFTPIAILDASARTFTDSTVDLKQTYYYQVVATTMVNGIQGNVCSSTVLYHMTPPKVTNLQATSLSTSSLKVSWSKIPGATSYTVYYSTSKNGTYKKIKTVTGSSCTKTGLTLGKTYYFKVYTNYTDAEGTYKSKAAIVSGKPGVKQVTKLNVKSTTYNSVSLSWSKSSDAQLYYVYRSTKASSGYKYIGKTSSRSYRDSSVKTKTTYYYKVVAVRKISGKYYQSTYSSVVSAKPLLKKTRVTKVTAGKKKVTLKYTSVAGASGYQIYRATSKTGSFKKLATAKGTTFINTTVKSNRTYYYKIRAYRVVGGKKIYGQFSPIVSKTAK